MVFVLDTNKRPLAPCHEAVARKLLKQGKAAIYKRYPFAIILKEIVDNFRPKTPYVQVIQRFDGYAYRKGVAKLA